ncbi:MAG: alpha/beta hydrolase [gamma proteobacterium symbiont of Bathyaustriella thionipta]|nr:alpha/beta hydrolase [gamma proteobacterium symbiont of Bathyaustriella thionipta]
MITVLSMIGLWLLLNVLMYARQPAMVFFPTADVQQTPAELGLAYEDVHLSTADGVTLHAWYVPAANSKKVVLFFHGNAGNITHRGESIDIFHNLGWSVFIVDYRGYGSSEGSPDEPGLYQDARAAWQFLMQKKHYAHDDIIVFGRSLGGVVAAQLAYEVQPRHLILESTLSSARDMADRILPGISRLLFSRYEFATSEKLAGIRSRILMLHSPDDEMIPFEQAQKNFRQANEPKSFITLDGGHNEGFLLSQPAYSQALHDFVTAGATQ